MTWLQIAIERRLAEIEAEARGEASRTQARFNSFI